MPGSSRDQPRKDAEVMGSNPILSLFYSERTTALFELRVKCITDVIPFYG
jgi:hypothetical protein